MTNDAIDFLNSRGSWVDVGLEAPSWGQWYLSCGCIVVAMLGCRRSASRQARFADLAESWSRRECRRRPAAFHHHHQQNHDDHTATASWPATRYGLLTVLEACALRSWFCRCVGFGLDNVWIRSRIVMTWSYTASPHSRWQTCIAIAFMDAPQSSRMVRPLW